MVAACVHAAYDLAILAHGATLVCGALVFALWGFVVVRAKRLVADTLPVACSNPPRASPAMATPSIARRDANR